MKVTERYPRETGRDYALRIIKDNIIRLELPPGALISENELTAELGLSRTPVREALIELSKVAVIEIQPQKKSVVASIDYDLIEEARFMRKVLECEVVKLVCGMATEADIAKLRENLALQKFYLVQAPENLLSLDDELHAKLFAIAKKNRVYALTRNLSIHFDRVRHMALTIVKDNKTVEDHERIVDAIAAGDKQAASAIMEKHLSRYKVDAAAIREKYPQYFHD